MVSDPPPSSSPVQHEGAWAEVRLIRSGSEDNGVLPCKVPSSSSSSLSEASADGHGQKTSLPPRPPRVIISKSAEEAVENGSGQSSGSPEDADVEREINAGADVTIDPGPPRTVVIPPPMAPYAQLCYNRAEDRMVTLMVGADHVVVRDKSGGNKREGGDGTSLYYLASPAPTPATKPGVDLLPGDGTQEDRDVTHHLPEVRAKRCDVSTHNTITEDSSGGAEADDEDDEDYDGAEAEDEDDELVYSKSSGLSSAFSMETIVNPSTAHSRSSFGETDTSSRNEANTSSGSSGGDAGSESTVVMFNNASRCRRSPQEIIWMDEAWLFECESVYGFRSSDRLALLHDVASGDDLDAYMYDADDDAMSDSCGKLLLMRSVALCKGKLKATPGFVASSPKRSASGASSSSHKSAAAGFLSGKLFEYTKL